MFRKSCMLCRSCSHFLDIDGVYLCGVTVGFLADPFGDSLLPNCEDYQRFE